jgi:archaellum biogenesis protein FlaJ (TadC family)
MMRVMLSIWFGAVVVWLGAAVFFSGVVLPVLFLRMAPAEAAGVAALVFPWYYRLGAVAGALALVAGAGLARASTTRAWRAATVIVALMLAAQCWGGFVVHPQMQRIRGQDSAVTRFQELHRLSVRLNGVVLVGGFALILAGGWLVERR